MGSKQGILVVGSLLALALVFLTWHRSTPFSLPILGAGTSSFEVHVLGGSTAYGEPYGPDLNPGSLASYLLGGEIAGRPIVVVNHAAFGGTSSHALDAVEDVPSDAGVVFLYSGHNEFLDIEEPDDLSQLPRRLIDVDPLSSAERRAILDQYEDNIAKIIERLKRRGVPLILSTVTSNLSDWEPNRSTLRDSRNAERVTELAARAAASVGVRPGSVEAWTEIVWIEPRFAWAHLELGNLDRSSGRYADARAHYRLAADHDALPYRALTSQNAALRRLAQEHDVPIVDVALAFGQASPNGLVGFELIWDNCHPRLEGYLIIARLLARELAKRFGLALPVVDDSPAAIEGFFGIDADDRFEILHARGQYAYVFSLLIWNPAERLILSKKYLEQASEIGTSAEVLASLGILNALFNRPGESGVYWRRALALDPADTRKRWNHHSVGEIMHRSPELQIEFARLQDEIGPRRWYDWLL